MNELTFELKKHPNKKFLNVHKINDAQRKTSKKFTKKVIPSGSRLNSQITVHVSYII